MCIREGCTRAQLGNALAAQIRKTDKLSKTKFHHIHHIDAGANPGGLYYLAFVHSRRHTRLSNHSGATCKSPILSWQALIIPHVVFVSPRLNASVLRTTGDVWQRTVRTVLYGWALYGSAHARSPHCISRGSSSVENTYRVVPITVVEFLPSFRIPDFKEKYLDCRV
jgi:hypothetical protein